MFLKPTLCLFFKAGGLKAERGEGEKEALPPKLTQPWIFTQQRGSTAWKSIYAVEGANGTPEPHHNTNFSWMQFSARVGLVKVPAKTLS